MQITGAGCVSFEKSVRFLSVIKNYFERRLKKSLLPMDDNVFNSFPALKISNRLLTPRKTLGYDREKQVPTYIDPLKIIPAIAGDEYVYARENHVLYTKQDTEPP